MAKLPEDWATAEAVLRGAYRVLLYGPPGTGKTYAGRHYAVDGRDVFNVYVGEDSAAYDVMGHDVVVDGSMIWRDGPGVRAWRRGARLVINELHKASGDTLDAIVALTDDRESAGITLPTGEYVEPAAGFQVVATMNGEPEDLPEHLASRFAVRVRIENPHPDAIAALPANLRKTAQTLTGPRVEESRRMNLRQFSSYAELVEHGVDEETAARACFYEQAGEILDALTVRRTAAA